jgi:two-component system sensor histidine kinase BaeS
LRGDAIKLRQAVMNLVDNAVRYTPAGGTIRIAARRAGNRALIEVRDSGPGITARHLQHIFEPFYRVDTARSGGEGHVGMGLALAAWIVRAHGGQITISSHLGEGTAFTLSLPLAAT